MAKDEQKRIFSKNLTYYMNTRGVSVAELSEKIGIPESTIGNWTSGQNYPRIDKIQVIADFFGIYKSDLQEEKDSIKESDMSFISQNLVPVVGKVAAGKPNYAIEDVTGYMMLPPNKQKNDSMIYLEVSSDSMDVQFPVGSFVLVDTQAQVENGDVAVVKVNGNDATLKQVKFDEGRTRVILIPKSHNDSHYPQILDVDTDEISVVGKVVGMYMSI